jgi:hypothetical protein
MGKNQIWRWVNVFVPFFGFNEDFYTNVGHISSVEESMGRIKYGAKNFRFIFWENMFKHIFHAKTKRSFHCAPCFIRTHFPLYVTHIFNKYKITHIILILLSSYVLRKVLVSLYIWKTSFERKNIPSVTRRCQILLDGICFEDISAIFSATDLRSVLLFIM